MKLILKYEETDIYKLSNIVTNWAENEEIEEENADWILDEIRSGHIWRQMEGIPEDWDVLDPEDEREISNRGTILASITAYELDEDGDYDVDKPIARTERAIAKVMIPETWDALVNLMDDDLREQVHQELAPCTNAEFLKRYAELHKQKYHEDFPPEQI